MKKIHWENVTCEIDVTRGRITLLESELQEYSNEVNNYRNLWVM